MNRGTVTKRDVSLLAQEIHCVLIAAEMLEGEPEQGPLYWAAERLAESLVTMTEGLEANKTLEEVMLSRISNGGESR